MSHILSSTTPTNMTSSESNPNANSAFAVPPQRQPLNSPCLGVYLGVYLEHNRRISTRTILDSSSITLQGWPSRGGIIVLENATAPDFDYLGLDALDPPLRRAADQDAEDAFCRGLLRLGATWWDSEARWRFVGELEHQDEDALEAVENDPELAPSRKERGWVRVAWSEARPGALCILECQKIILGRDGTEKLRPRHYAIVGLARTMDERFEVLQRLGGTVYDGIDEYQGPTFIKAWEENHHGEKGPLVQYEFEDPSKYSGHPDDALGRFGTST